MKPSLEKLQKFFKLEAERGYDNHAVLGGLERILDRWEAEARIDGLPEDLIQVVVERLRDYPRLTSSSRAEVLEGLWRRIQRELGGSPVEEREISPQSERQPPAEEKPPEEQAPAGEVTIESTTSTQQAPEKTTQPVQEKPAPKAEPAALGAPVTVLSGVGPRHAQTLGRLGMKTLRDMLYYFPRRYDDYSQLKPINRLWYGEEVTVIGTVQSVTVRPIRNGRSKIVEMILSDGSGSLRVTWFNQVYIAKRLRKGAHIVLSGKIDQYLGRLVMNNPEWEPLEQQQLSTNRIVPVYPLTAQITQRWLRRLMNQVVSYWAPRVVDPLPDNLRRSAGLVELSRALLQSHFPDSWEDLKAARHRLAFDEIFLLQLGVLRQKQAWQERSATVFDTDPAWLQSQLELLPFELTEAQQRALEDVRQDLASGHPMNRLIQGDVGSGKTVIAAMAVAMVAHQGGQTALMAPTSILAEQHYQSLLHMLSLSEDIQTDTAGEEAQTTPQLPLQEAEIRLMIGATPEAEKSEIRQGLENGSIKLVIGTHALIEDPVVFKDLELAIVDEQHRFGVEQRAALRSKGENPHLLVMTATPIPRSLALTIYGDLDLSVIDEMPPGRQAVHTHVLPPRELERAYSLIRNQVESGRQAFIIYPLVEESDKLDSKAAVDEYDRLRKEIFPDLQLGLLHGRMKPEEKEQVMHDFRSGKYQILVSTSVVEVGVDVPNATVMLIEGANRFGLAQLHQFRGRVGRGADKSYCLLVPETPDDIENKRLQVMAQTNDGFVLAEHDLDQRGPGEFLGTRQSGFSELQLANLTDVSLIEKARRHAQELFRQDSDLASPELQPLNEALERFWGDGRGDIS